MSDRTPEQDFKEELYAIVNNYREIISIDEIYGILVALTEKARMNLHRAYMKKEEQNEVEERILGK